MVTLFSADDWKTRLRNSVEGDPARIVFVVGAGLSWDGKVGVWGVSEIVKHIKDTYTIEPSADPSSAAYQEVMAQLKGKRGAEL